MASTQRAVQGSLSWFKSRPGLHASPCRATRGAATPDRQGEACPAKLEWNESEDGLEPRAAARRRAAPLRILQKSQLMGRFWGFRGCGNWSKDQPRARGSLTQRMIRQSVGGLARRSCAHFQARARSDAKPVSTFADRALVQGDARPARPFFVPSSAHP